MVYYLSNLPDGLIYGLLAMGIYISLRILDIPDLTTEGSFGFGAGISVLISFSPVFLPVLLQAFYRLNYLYIRCLRVSLP